MSLLATSIQRPSLAFQAAKPVSRVSVRSVRVVAKNTGPGLGNSDPQKVKEQKDAKKSGGQWGEPSNKNPLEKQTVNRQSPTGQSKGLKDEGKINKEQVKQGTQGEEGEKNWAEKAGDAIAGGVDKIRPDKE